MEIPSVAHAASRILDALRTRDNAALRTSLRFRCPSLDHIPPDAAERWDLLDAIATELRRPSHVSGGLEVHLSLLGHLVESQRWPAI